MQTLYKLGDRDTKVNESMYEYLGLLVLSYSWLNNFNPHPHPKLSIPFTVWEPVQGPWTCFSKLRLPSLANC